MAEPTLKLRPMEADDFDGFHAMMSDYDVVKMSMSWPWPSESAFTRARMQTPEVKAGHALSIEADGQFAGQISLIKGELGYMLAKPFWGRGIATWAVHQMLAKGFSDPETNSVTAGTWDDNPASMRVLTKCGFQKTGEATLFCEPRGQEVNGPDYELTRENWAQTQPFFLKTERLRIEPFDGTEARALSNLMNDPDVARMMATIPHPFNEEQAAAWLAERPFMHSLDSGFRVKISLHSGTLIGFAGIGGEPVNTAYALGRDYWGQGYATEAMKAFLDHAIGTFALSEITAGAMFDNPASHRVLEKLGFDKTGEKMHKASGRLEKAPLFLYRLAGNDRTNP